MTLQIGFSSTGAGIQYDLAAYDSDIVFGQNVFVASTGSHALRGTSSYHSVHVAGMLYGADDGIHLGDADTDTGSTVFVAATGNVSALDDAISIQGDRARIENHGTVSGNYGVYLFGTSGDASITNYGVISGEYQGIRHSYGTNTTLTVVNYGTISAGDRSTGDAFFSGLNTLTDKIVNRGLMVGGIDFGAGDDSYDGRGGTVTGTIFGGAGVDTFRPGMGIETIIGDSGNDLLDFRVGGAIQVALDAAIANTGTAEGDEYSDIENIYGSAFGNDLLRGNALNNGFYGFGGNDTLQGGAGVDQLVGGAGTDTLSGGAGNDTFVFLALTEAGDVIADFGNVGGNDDRFVIKAAAFGPGLVAGALDPDLFFSGPSNTAGGTEDRFVFNTTTTTLWFDSNGSGAGGLTMIADLQAGVALTAADIVLI
ncbi:MAG: calcium-binding protein [Paracoccaceae bacterium]